MQYAPTFFSLLFFLLYTIAIYLILSYSRFWLLAPNFYLINLQLKTCYLLLITHYCIFLCALHYLMRLPRPDKSGFAMTKCFYLLAQRFGIGKKDRVDADFLSRNNILFGIIYKDCVFGLNPFLL